MDRDYIDALNRAYEAHFGQYMGTRLLTIDSSAIDFVANGKDLASIEKRVRQALEIPPFQPQLPFQVSANA
jgi:deoxyadenosine/deoxycytidine kinase